MYFCSRWSAFIAFLNLEQKAVILIAIKKIAKYLDTDWVLTLRYQPYSAMNISLMLTTGRGNFRKNYTLQAIKKLNYHFFSIHFDRQEGIIFFEIKNQISNICPLSAIRFEKLRQFVVTECNRLYI